MIESLIPQIENARKYYYQYGMLYFYKNNFVRTMTTFVFDVNDMLWKKHIKLIKYSPSWKIAYIFTEDDYKTNLKRISKLISKNAFGKVLEIYIDDTLFIMVLFYVIGNEKRIVSSVYNGFELSRGSYSKKKLYHSKKVNVNAFISQGEGWHRDETEKNKLDIYFCGVNNYKYRGK